MEWPPQDTGYFAVAFCAQCLAPLVDTLEIRNYGDSFPSMYGFDALDSSGGRWRTQSGSGTFNINYYNDGACEDFGVADTAPIGGSACAMDRYGTITGDCPFFNSPAESANYDGGVVTPSTYVLTGNGDCVVQSAGIYASATVTGAQTITLGIPWTPADAIAESEATGLSDWSFIALDAYVIDTWETWDGVSNTFGYSRLDFRRTRNGYNPSTSYDVTMEVYQDDVPYATLEDTVVSDTTGTIVWVGAYPHAEGHHYNVIGSTFAAVPTP